MPYGTIKRLMAARGNGLITSEGREALFFRSSRLQGVDYNSLRAGQQVEFEVGLQPNGVPQAVKVRLPQGQDE